MLCIELLTRERPLTDCASICVAIRIYAFHAEAINTLQFNTDAPPALIDKLVTGLGCTYAEVEYTDNDAVLDEAEAYCRNCGATL